MRLRTDLWVAAYLRRVMVGGAFVAVRKKGVAEAGAIFIRIDRLDGSNLLFGPASQSLVDASEGGRQFRRMHETDTIDGASVESRLGKEQKFDPDLWIIEVEDRQGRSFLDGFAG